MKEMTKITDKLDELNIKLDEMLKLIKKLNEGLNK